MTQTKITENTEENNENTHYHHFRDGTISVTRWEHINSENKSKWYSYTVQRSYNKATKGQNPEYANTNSLRTQDLLKTAELLKTAYTEEMKSKQE